MNETKSFCLMQAVNVHCNTAKNARIGSVDQNIPQTADQIVKAAEKFNDFMKEKSDG